ncbi:MAG: hypothetical protein ABSE49_04710 [Polyangiaceae bacterium]
MTRAEALFALIGGVVGLGSAVATIEWWDPRLTEVTSRRAARDANDTRDRDPDAGDDPAMVANANLVASLQECSQRLTFATSDESRVEQALEAERMAAADASQSSQARRRARRDPSPSDWKQLASTGTVRYLLPCATFTPTPEAMGRLGLAPQDVPAIQSAFIAARADAWAQIRPLCATAAGSAATADNLGLDLCPQIILNAEKTADPAAADRAMRAVAAARAGLLDPSAVPAGDPVAAAFLVMTGVAKDAEEKLGAVLGPEDAHAALYGSGSCARTSEFSSPLVAAPL